MSAVATKWILGCWLLASCVCQPALVWGQGQDSGATATGAGSWQNVPIAQQEQAQKVFDEGNRLFQIPIYPEAAAKYKEAIALWPHPRFYYNLAMAQLNLDQSIEAYDSLEHAMRGGESVLGKAKYEQARTHRRVLESQLGRLEVSCAVPGAEVSLDGRRLFTAPGHHQELVLAGKRYQVKATKSEHIPDDRPITVLGGETETIELRPKTYDEAAESSRRWPAWKPWATIGAGAAVTLAGMALHSRSAANFDEFDAAYKGLECGKPGVGMAPGCTDVELGAELVDQLARADVQQYVAVGSYIAGGAVMITGAVLVYLNRPRLSAKESREQTSPMTLTPLLSPTQAGMSVGFRF